MRSKEGCARQWRFTATWWDPVSSILPLENRGCLPSLFHTHSHAHVQTSTSSWGRTLSLLFSLIKSAKMHVKCLELFPAFQFYYSTVMTSLIYFFLFVCASLYLHCKCLCQAEIISLCLFLSTYLWWFLKRLLKSHEYLFAFSFPFLSDVQKNY